MKLSCDTLLWWDWAIRLTSRMTGGVEPQSEAARLYTVRVDAIVGILFFKVFLNKLFDVSGQMLL